AAAAARDAATPAAGLPSPPPAAAVAPAATAAETPATRLDRWTRRLLDLSLHNRLINFRETRHTIPLCVDDVAALEDALADGVRFTLVPRPELASGGAQRDAALHYERTGEDLLQSFVGEQRAQGRLVAQLGEAELERRQVEIGRHARTVLEESGANTLH